MNALLEIKDFSVDFTSNGETTRALQNISFTLNRGEIVALVGESGSGKSVTALSILQLLPSPPARYASGQILFSETGTAFIDILQISRHAIGQIRDNKIAMVFQEPMTSLNPVLTCGNQVAEAILLHTKTSAGKRISRKESRKQAIEWFAKVKLPDPERIFHRYPHELSGGQKQRVMIAMAMCCHPALLVCDEPTTALDVTVQKTILELIRELQEQENMGVIFITHDLGVVAEIADRAIVMYKGKIVEENAVKEIFQNPQHPYTRALLACRPVNHRRGERLPVVSDFMNPSASPQDDNDRIPNSQLPIPIQPQTLFNIQNLSVWFPGRRNFAGRPANFVKAVNDVSFDIYEGETLGLVGESGCGKTTLGRALLRLIDPTSGKIIYRNMDLASAKKTQWKALRKEIQIIFQDPYSSLNPRLIIGGAIAEPMKVHGIAATDKQRKERVMELLMKVGLQPAHFNRYPHEFSGGQRQRIVIARALALGPSFIVCDESVSALDVSVQAQVLNLLNDLKKEFGFTIVFISHDLSVVRYISDRIMVMNNGRVEESGDPEEIYNNPQSAYTRKLIESIPRTVFV